MKKVIALILFLTIAVCAVGCQTQQAQAPSTTVPTTQMTSPTTEEASSEATTMAPTEDTYTDWDEETDWYEEPEVDNALPEETDHSQQEDYTEEPQPQEDIQ